MEGAPPPAKVASELGKSAVTLLQRMIRFDTVNPPGNERALQEELAATLTEAGFECELLAAEPERPNLLARLRGPADGPTLTLLGHVDTVRADPSEWTRDPWSGDLTDGWVWGRGALDMKGQVASEIAAGISLAASGWRPARGELLLAVVADEETGGALGARWLCEEQPAKVRSDMVLNEGGGGLIEIGGRRLYTLACGEKGVFRARVRTSGQAGHASMPRIGDNALLKLAPLLERLSGQPPLEPTPAALGFLTAALGEPVDPAGFDAAMARLRAEAPLICDYLAEPIAGVTMAPTRAKASEKANVIPSSAEILVDCRVPPGMTGDQVRERIDGLFGGEGYSFEFSEAIVGNASAYESELTEAIRRWVAEADPGAELVPTVMPGFSDSHWFRTAFPAAIVYGFCPHRDIDLLAASPLIHGADERVPAADVGFAAAFFAAIAADVLGAA